ncbi:MAG: PA2778 family cysteine peptidase [Xanthomonadales bacterium]|nr:PA2778 family cysteine peptidase [Xanthomonadales bacterium]
MRQKQHPAAPRFPACGWMLLCASALLSACSINPPVDLAEVAETSEGRQLDGIPFFPQTEFRCGPAALAGVLGAAGVATTADELSPQVYLPERQGSLQVELLAATRRAGLVAYQACPEMAGLVAEIEAGWPVLVLQNLRTRHFPVWHYAVVTGFDPVNNTVVLNSGTEEQVPVPAPRFLRTWDWGGRWAMVALRPGQMPACPDPLRYAQAVAAFEQVAGSQAAIPAWRAAAEQWPEDHRPRFALGNLYLSTGQQLQAIHHYRLGLAANPGDAALENNLATALAEAGCPRMAEQRLEHVRQALAADSPWRPDIEGTIAELAALGGQDAPRCKALWSEPPAIAN